MLMKPGPARLVSATMPVSGRCATSASATARGFLGASGCGGGGAAGRGWARGCGGGGAHAGEAAERGSAACAPLHTFPPAPHHRKRAHMHVASPHAAARPLPRLLFLPTQPSLLLPQPAAPLPAPGP